MHIHILGVCGTFMGSLARIAKEAGHTVTGCDANVYPPMSTQLAECGIDIVSGYGPEQADIPCDLFVVGNVVSRGNPLMEEILNRGLPYISGPQWIGENILPSRHVVAVAGTHGKTTTTSMVAWILESAGLNPGFLIGGVPVNFGVSSRIGSTEKDSFFVIEADEYDTAFFDKRSKFVHYRPRTAVLNNLEYDHADIFENTAAIETQFHHLVRTMASNALAVVNDTAPSLKTVLSRGVWCDVAWFGNDASKGWTAGEEKDGAFDIFEKGEYRGTLSWELTGEHNRMNALAAIAAAKHCGVAPADAIKALSSFRSVKRRMENLGTVSGVTVYDDFAHHPTAIETTVSGLRAKMSAGRILAVLEPRSNTMKLGVMKDRLPASLDKADLVFVYGEKDGKNAQRWDVEGMLRPIAHKAGAYFDLGELVGAVASAAKPGDAVLVMSNGGFGGVHGKILAALKEK